MQTHPLGNFIWFYLLSIKLISNKKVSYFRAQDIDYPVPAEYLINVSIREKLAQLKLKQYKEDLLFFLFYSNVGDVMQLAAANELWVSTSVKFVQFLWFPQKSYLK